jgi:hypothetical protein
LPLNSALLGRTTALLALVVSATGCSQFFRIQQEDAAMAMAVVQGVAQVRARKLAPGTPFTFAVFGDSRGGLDVTAAEIKKINAAHVGFAIYTGDLVGEGTEDEYKAGMVVLNTCEVPILPAPGNHERKDIELYAKYFQQPLDYAVDYGDWRFLSVDNSLGSLSNQQMAWLKVQTDANRPTLIFAHEPPVMGPWTHGFTENADAFNQLVADHKNVKACMFGHMHLYDHAVVNGVPYVISGGGGAPIDDTFKLLAPDGFYGYNYLLCQVQGDQFSYKMYKFTDIPIRKKPPRMPRDAGHGDHEEHE